MEVALNHENQILLGDCLELMETLDAASVDCVLTDLPYGTTCNEWDTVLPMDKLWHLWRRVLRPSGPVVLFTQQPFTTVVAASNLKRLRTEWIWEKNIPTGFLNARVYPLKSHENILVFCERKPPYNPQMVEGTLQTHRASDKCSVNYGKVNRCPARRSTQRFPRTVLKFAREQGKKGGLHPTQKPLALCEYLIRTYTQPGQMVLDCCAGSGTTLLAARNTDRKFIGIERDPTYHALCVERLAS